MKRCEERGHVQNLNALAKSLATWVDKYRTGSDSDRLPTWDIH
jgi:hypothetical protein